MGDGVMMTKERFIHLLDAYGADWSRWPQAEVAPARALMASDAELQSQWRDAGALDDLLGHERSVPSADLRERVIALAAVAGLKPRRERRAFWTLLSGAGVAATAMAGVVLGVLLAQQIVAPIQAETVFYQASLHGTDDAEVLGLELASLETYP